MRKKGIDGTKVLNLYDRVTGVFNEIFDARLLTVSFFALLGYCALFTQRKFPMRWFTTSRGQLTPRRRLSYLACLPGVASSPSWIRSMPF